MFYLFFLFIFCQFHPDYQFLEDVVVEVMLICYFFPLLKLLLEVEVHPEGFCIDLVEVW